jgi:hypothetical protein
MFALPFLHLMPDDAWANAGASGKMKAKARTANIQMAWRVITFLPRI